MILRQLIFGLTILFTSQSWSDLKKHYFHFPFDQAIQAEKVYEVTQVSPSELVKYIESQGVQVLIFRDVNTQSTNPAFSKTATASEQLIADAKMPPNTMGRLLPQRNGFSQNTILIRADADTYTLIHEYLHALLFFEGQKPISQLDEKFAAVERKQIFYQRKLFENPAALLNPLWRKDILEAQEQVIELIYQRIQIGQSQEAIIEKLLNRYIDSKNPHYSEVRQKKGLQYAEAMINNAITVFNNLHFSVNWNKNTVAELSQGLKTKDVEIAQPDRESLTEEEASQFQMNSAAHLQKLQKTMDEILKLKKFFLEF